MIEGLEPTRKRNKNADRKPRGKGGLGGGKRDGERWSSGRGEKKSYGDKKPYAKRDGDFKKDGAKKSFKKDSKSRQRSGHNHNK